MNSAKVIIYGYGNPGRQDDGLGPALVERLEGEALPGVETRSAFQLNIEDAQTIADAGTVIFVDASMTGDGPFAFHEIVPSAQITFTTHAMSPGSVLALCQDLFNPERRAYMLSIRGYEWEFREGFSAGASGNLEQAYAFVMEKLAECVSRVDGAVLSVH
ncbi:MAG TPA: hydrogenase maturation protease [Spirochaetota bacterium]|nr:hydrogenase maturation protease [Spirochaetota bacterium]HNT12896.1 hydrogenase maturation protease [Spirochaetota bacterium]HNV47648.1 hydrogenase maturation protease [Spirochaetota bacterium]HOS40484.1 hydrogenase maturation protease [Spirochaetota bacterium]HPU90339.1 hydrogenase maturation protease [Spirochaetota bacterium]